MSQREGNEFNDKYLKKRQRNEQGLDKKNKKLCHTILMLPLVKIPKLKGKKILLEAPQDSRITIQKHTKREVTFLLGDH